MTTYEFTESGKDSKKPNETNTVKLSLIWTVRHKEMKSNKGHSLFKRQEVYMKANVYESATLFVTPFFSLQFGEGSSESAALILKGARQ